ncbi:hypothetical protein A0H81_03310 [Grifola frondosa]|uniref:F-box domain-containing protein n=1 Tax=Grifola frondosa TaxID=5627 RepID=A0A1C7MGU4_GRIFR|nr:hypothetical protein A0H81_03310 [Grifola frondosa]
MRHALHFTVTHTSYPTGDATVVRDEHGLCTEYLHRICTEAPHLRHFELSWMHSSAAPSLVTQHKTASVLPAFTHLATLALAWNVACAPSIILALSTLPRLKNLTIDRFYTSVGANEVLPFVLPTDGFESLESLNLQLPFRAAYQILLAFPVAQLKIITLYMDDRCWIHEQLDITRFVAHAFCRSLERFHFRAPEYPDNKRCPLSLDVINLLQTIDLIDVELGWVDPRDITDALCESMARAWPRLERLELLPMIWC